MQEIKGNLLNISGVVEEVIYKNTENGYIVLDLDSNGEQITVVGELGDIVEGERLELYGSYVNTAKYGRQFKAETCQRSLPDTPAEIRKYLGSGIIKGLGPALAKKIVDKFGADSLDIIDNDPLSLSEIKGVTADRALYISNEFRRLSGIKNVIEFLQQYQISPAVAVTLWRMYEADAINRVKENPYILCDEAIGVDFEQADAIAESLGLDKFNQNRVLSAIIYTLRRNSDAGHTCLPYTRLREVACDFIGVDEDSFDKGLQAGVEAGQLDALDISEKTYIYLHEYYRAETYIALRLAEMLKLSVPKIKDFADEIAGVEFTENIQYETLQKAAINGSLGNNLFILTGGPGTGKTTTLNGIIQILKRQKKTLALAAPTGRAAKRMSDLTGEDAKTIHRLLEVDFSKTDKLAFKRNERNPLKADVVIIDEMSMVDALLFESLLRAIKTGASLIMVGDSNQLPSVGAGNILRDLIAGGEIPTVELKEIFRQAAESMIVTNAHDIVNGEYPYLESKDNDFFFLPRQTEAECASAVCQLCEKRLPKAYGFSPLWDIQVLCPGKRGEAGTWNLNIELQKRLNPADGKKKEFRHGGHLFREGDKVMQTKNDYDMTWSKDDGEVGRGVFNGDIGIIEKMDPIGRMMAIRFDDRVAEYPYDSANELDHAYAVTVHKSQGSEFEAVILPLFEANSRLYYRNLLYTAVTRAKKLLIIVGSAKAVMTMVDNNRKSGRFTNLRFMIKE
mgnify:CR=1 FL=1